MKPLLALLICCTLGAADSATAAIEAWARSLHQAFAEGRGGPVLQGAMDLATLSERAVDGLGLSAADRAEFIKGVRNSQLGENSLHGQIAAQVAQGGTYRFRRVVARGDGPRALFRLVGPDGLSNWHELVIRQQRGAVRVVDIDIYVTGELVSTTIRTFSVLAQVGQKPSLLERLLGSSGKEAEALVEGVTEARRHQQAGRHQQALNRLRALPAEAQKAKLIAFLKVQSAQAMEESIYLAELDSYARLFPADPGQALMSIDAEIMRKRWDRALAAIATLEVRTGEDAQVECLRANVQQMAGQAELARLHGQRATALEPDWNWGWYTRIGLGLEAKDWDEVATALDGLAANGMDVEQLVAADLYAPFRASPVFTAWYGRRASATAAAP